MSQYSIIHSPRYCRKTPDRANRKRHCLCG